MIHLVCRSTVATFVGAFDAIRTAFAKATKQPAGLFSFNSKGACPDCKGIGSTAVEMAFMDTARVRCDTCEGRRFAPSVLDHKLRGKSIAEVLALTVDDAHRFFTEKRVKPHLQRLVDVGLGYAALGQTLDTLSGGEAQRLKLATELHRCVCVRDVM
jgi:excinuclease UvrABC ATPase subunit